MSPLLSADEIERGLRAAGVPAPKARAEAARLADSPDQLAGVLPTVQAAEESRLERAEVTRADKQMGALGFRTINTSQPRHAKYITPGVPDRFYFHRARRIGLAWEAKADGGRQSPSQRDFQDDMDACGWPYVLGPALALFDWLAAHHPVVWDDAGHLVWTSPHSDTPLPVPHSVTPP